MWRGPWKRAQRCLIPAIGFYEWHVLEGGGRQPYYIHAADQAVFCFAGIWDASRREDGTEILSAAIITLPGNELLRSIHNAGANPHRMPAMLSREQQQIWLAGETAAAEASLQPYPAELMSAWPVSLRVNSPKNDDASLIDPVAQA